MTWSNYPEALFNVDGGPKECLNGYYDGIRMLPVDVSPFRSDRTHVGF